MRSIRWLLLLLSAIAYPQNFKDDGDFSPYGPSSDEIKDIISRARKNPDALNELVHRPLEETYEALKRVGGYSDAADPNARQLVPIAKDILYNHPDFENFMHRIMRKITKLNSSDIKMPTKPNGEVDLDALRGKHHPEPQTEEDRQKLKDNIIAERLRTSILGTILQIPSPEMQIRLLGPCLESTDYWLDMEYHIKMGWANYAAERLVEPIKKVTGETIPRIPQDGRIYDVKYAREWWKRNEAKYRWTPPGETPAPPPQIAAPTPRPKRVLLNAKSIASEKNAKHTGSDATPPKTEGNPAKSNWWVWAVLISALSLVALAAWYGKPTSDSQQQK